jgi:hypothetical protein
MTHDSDLSDSQIVDLLVSIAESELPECNDVRAVSAVIRQLAEDIVSKTKQGRNYVTDRHRKRVQLALESALRASEFYETYPYMTNFGLDEEVDEKVLSPLKELHEVLVQGLSFETVDVFSSERSKNLVKKYLGKLTREATWSHEIDVNEYALSPIRLTATWVERARDAALNYSDGPELLLTVESRELLHWDFHSFGDPEIGRYLMVFDVAPSMEVLIHPGSSSVEEELGFVLVFKNVSVRLNLESLFELFPTVVPGEMCDDFEWSREYVENITLRIDRQTGAVLWSSLV